MNRSLTITFVLLLILSPAAQAQKKKKTPTPKRKPAPAASAPAPPPVDTKLETTQAADTLKAITKFIFIYGKIVNGLELADDQSRRGRLAPRVIEQNVENKNGVVRGISGLKAQVDKLSQALQSNPRLQIPYVNLAGVTQKLVEAQELVQGNKYDDAGRSLVAAAERLTDILTQMK